MSSHADDQTVTIAEVRVAMGPILNCSDKEERIIAELIRPAIHPSVYMIYPSGTIVRGGRHDVVERGTVLIPAPKVREIGDEVIHRAVVESAVAAKEELIKHVAHYTETGE